MFSKHCKTSKSLGTQGFVSNKDTDTTGEKGDPIEGLLYATFVASTERADVASLAEVLNVELGQLQEAVSIACRLGFGTRRERTQLPSDSDSCLWRCLSVQKIDVLSSPSPAASASAPAVSTPNSRLIAAQFEVALGEAMCAKVTIGCCLGFGTPSAWVLTTALADNGAALKAQLYHALNSRALHSRLLPSFEHDA